MSFILFVLGSATLPFSDVRPILNLDISDLFFLASLIALIPEFWISKNPIKKKSFFHPFLIPSFLILIGGLLSSFIRSPYIYSSLSELIKTLYVFSIFSFMVFRVITSERRVEVVLNAILAGIIFSSAVAIIDSRLGTRIGPSIAIHTTYPGYYGSGGRFAGVTSHPNFQGYYTAMALTIIVGFVFRYKGKFFICAAYIVAFIICADGLILTGSMSSLGGAAVGLFLVILTWLWGSVNKRFVLLFSTGVLLSVTLLFIITEKYDTWYKEIVNLAMVNPNISRVVNATFEGRVIANDYALAEIVQNPLIGVGLDEGSQNSYAPVDQYGNPGGVHNAFVRAFLGGGVFVFLGYLIIYFYSLKLTFRACLNWINDKRRTWLLGLAGATLTFTIIDMAQPAEHIRISWLILFILYLLVDHPGWIYPHRLLN